MKVKGKRIVRRNNIQFKVGDRIIEKIVYGNFRLNNTPATIKTIRWIRYYPNRDYSVIVFRPQAEIIYDNGVISYPLIDCESFELCK